MVADMNLMALMEHFQSEERCRIALESIRWPDGVRCPRCQSEKVWPTARLQFDCGSCGYRFSVTSGTIFHDTRVPLPKWFLATYLMVESKKSMSAMQIQRTLDIKTYKTAWYLCHRIRAAMKEAQTPPLEGTVEVDETFIGGKVKGHGKGYVGNKAIVIGAAERHGRIRLEVIDDTSKKTLHGFVRQTVAPDAEAIYTDERAGYNGVETAQTRHESVNHKAEEYVRGDVHTNSIENVWSLLDRSIMGAFHHVSLKHLDSYLEEQEWRFNNRDDAHLFRDTLKKLIASPNLRYSDLTE